jgi:hypothetical protein
MRNNIQKSVPAPVHQAKALVVMKGESILEPMGQEQRGLTTEFRRVETEEKTGSIPLSRMASILIDTTVEMRTTTTIAAIARVMGRLKCHNDRSRYMTIPDRPFRLNNLAYSSGLISTYLQFRSVTVP